MRLSPSETNFPSLSLDSLSLIKPSTYRCRIVWKWRLAKEWHHDCPSSWPGCAANLQGRVWGSMTGWQEFLRPSGVRRSSGIVLVCVSCETTPDTGASVMPGHYLFFLEIQFALKNSGRLRSWLRLRNLRKRAAVSWSFQSICGSRLPICSPIVTGK